MLPKRNKAAKRSTNVELNITSFMNLMVALIPFLLMSAVFTNTSILDLHLPKPDTAAASVTPNEQFAISVIIRKDALTLIDQNGGVIKDIPKISSGHNYNLLNQVLKQVKSQYPDKTDITILSERNTPYDEIVQVMDKSREFHSFENNEIVAYDLFPDISIGDAPAITGSTP
jgi:biopolymer transport protein ExbD